MLVRAGGRLLSGSLLELNIATRKAALPGFLQAFDDSIRLYHSILQMLESQASPRCAPITVYSKHRDEA